MSVKIHFCQYRAATAPVAVVGAPLPRGSVVELEHAPENAHVAEHEHVVEHEHVAVP